MTPKSDYRGSGGENSLRISPLCGNLTTPSLIFGGEIAASGEIQYVAPPSHRRLSACVWMRLLGNCGALIRLEIGLLPVRVEEATATSVIACGCRDCSDAIDSRSFGLNVRLAVNDCLGRK